MNTQPKTYSLSKNDLISLGKGLLLAVGGAALTYLSQKVGNINYGVYTPIAVALLSVVLNIARKVLDGVQS